MSDILVAGCGAVSPAGWTMESMRDALAKQSPLPARELMRPGWNHPHSVRSVPLQGRPVYINHPRLRRTSPVSQYAASAALESLRPDFEAIKAGKLRVGVILCVMAGCVNYSKRFYNETLRDPATASPLVFPETVFNAPASHISAMLGSSSINYTLVGDPGTFLIGLATAADWLLNGEVDGCVVVGAEEHDWLTAEAFGLFDSTVIVSDGAGALYLKVGTAKNHDVRLSAVTDAFQYCHTQSIGAAASAMRKQLPSFIKTDLLCDSQCCIQQLDAPEHSAWSDWSGERVSPKIILGEGLAAASAWQCATACDGLQRGQFSAANVSVIGCNQQAIGARFERLS